VLITGSSAFWGREYCSSRRSFSQQLIVLGRRFAVLEPAYLRPSAAASLTFGEADFFWFGEGLCRAHNRLVGILGPRILLVTPLVQPAADRASTTVRRP